MALLDRLRRRPSKNPRPVWINDAALGITPIAQACQDARATGDFAAAANLLTGIGQDWESRAIAVKALGHAASSPDDAAWLDGWRKAAPDDADMLAVQAEALVARAWQVRGGGWASETSRSAFAEFGSLLGEAEPVALKATVAYPDDPTSWATLLTVNRGLQQPRETFDARWQELIARAPHHGNGHFQALLCLSEKWSGSHGEMYAFAREAAAAAPAGSPLKLLVLQAHFEYVLRVESQSDDAGVDLCPMHWSTHEVRADLDAALAHWPQGHGVEHPAHLWCRSIIGYACAQSGRWSDLACQISATSHKVYEYPWYYRHGSYVDIVHDRAFQPPSRR